MKNTFNSKFNISAVIIAICLNSFTVFSQENKFSIVINAVNTNFNYGQSDNNLDEYKKAINGFQVGVSDEIILTKKFSIVPSLYFIMKGGSLNEGNQMDGKYSKLRFYNLEFPVQAKFTIGHFFVGAGPYISYSLAGKLKTIESKNTPEITSNVTFGNDKGDYNRWETGLQFSTGYAFPSRKREYILGLHYGHGLTNISNNFERYNRVFSISLNILKKNE
jgi:hypothetical protein